MIWNNRKFMSQDTARVRFENEEARLNPFGQMTKRHQQTAYGSCYWCEPVRSASVPMQFKKGVTTDKHRWTRMNDEF